jgi:ATP-binding cassette subfamily B protein
MYGSWTGIVGSKPSLVESLALLEQPLPKNFNSEHLSVISFDYQLTLRNVSFAYGPKLPLVLNDVNLIIKKGSRLGFIGKTGGGKSTLLDIVMALLTPTSGNLLVDGVAITPENSRNWQKHIAHVPQSIFLSDCSILENIAFGIPVTKIDQQQVVLAAKQAQLHDLIMGWPQGYATSVGERGIRLSGGQRQRIGIARALYKKADVIIFDEATSSLDSETENSVMESINGLSSDLTLLIIAHRLTTLKGCSQIVELEASKIKRIIHYDQLFNSLT